MAACAAEAPCAAVLAAWDCACAACPGADVAEKPKGLAAGFAAALLASATVLRHEVRIAPGAIKRTYC